MKLTSKIIENYFDTFNDLYFEGKLERNFPCVVGRSATQSGSVRSSRITRKVEKFTISKVFAQNEEYIKDVILHEMVHVYIHQNKINDTSSHGIQFTAKVNDLNSRYNLGIDQKQVGISDCSRLDSKVGVLEVVGIGVLFFHTNLNPVMIQAIYELCGHKVKIGYTKNNYVRQFKVFQKNTVLSMSKFYNYNSAINEHIIPDTDFCIVSEDVPQ